MKFFNRCKKPLSSGRGIATGPILGRILLARFSTDLCSAFFRGMWSAAALCIIRSSNRPRTAPSLPMPVPQPLSSRRGLFARRKSRIASLWPSTLGADFESKFLGIRRSPRHHDLFSPRFHGYDFFSGILQVRSDRVRKRFFPSCSKECSWLADPHVST